MHKIARVTTFFMIVLFVVKPTISNAAFKKDSIKANWWYAGINFGAAYNNSKPNFDPNCASDGVGGVFCDVGSEENGMAVASAGDNRLSAINFVGGVQLGHNWQIQNFIYGGEADLNIYTLHDSKREYKEFPIPFLATTYALSQSVRTDLLTTVRGRAGYLLNEMPLMIYGTAGSAITNYRVSSQYADNAISPTFPGGFGRSQKSRIKLGLAVGGGGEWIFSNNITLKLEYLYLNFDSINLRVNTYNTDDFSQKMKIKFNLDAHMVRFGVNYKLTNL